MKKEVNALQIIKETITNIISGSKIILFGSRVKNIDDINSDYDLLIIVSEEIEIQKKFHYKALLRKIFVKSGIRSDIFIESEKEVKVKKRLPGHIVKTAINEGILL